ncbi:MAG: endonuclease/exonuclease/phosphatase family protein [Stackebrandtia sp.]
MFSPLAQRIRPFRRRLVAVLAVATVAAAAVTTAQLATAEDQSASSTRLKVMNWNIHGSTADLDAIAKKVKDGGIDVLTVQEIQRVPGKDQVMGLVKRLGWYTGDKPNVHFSQGDRPGPCDDEGKGWVGNAVMSKYPIAQKKTVKLSPDGQDCPVKRVMSGVKLNLPGNDYIRVWTSHFTPGNSQAADDHRHAQARKVIDYLGHDGPLLFTGDVNEKPDGGIRGAFVKSGWLDTGSKFGSEPTHNKARIDYIFAKKVKVNDVDVTDTKLSDHRPIVATMTVK